MKLLRKRKLKGRLPLNMRGSGRNPPETPAPKLLNRQTSQRVAPLASAKNSADSAPQVSRCRILLASIAAVPLADTMLIGIPGWFGDVLTRIADHNIHA